MIGDDERLRQQQTLLTMTKRQVADRDARISTLQADLNAAVASCTESKRRAEAEGARAGEAEARADTAEKARTSATADVNRLRLTAANLEERLRAAEGKIGEAERERRRLEYGECVVCCVGLGGVGCLLIAQNLRAGHCRLDLQHKTAR
jgi:chromosome segregation ATPase